MGNGGSRSHVAGGAFRQMLASQRATQAAAAENSHVVLAAERMAGAEGRARLAATQHQSTYLRVLTQTRQEHPQWAMEAATAAAREHPDVVRARASHEQAIADAITARRAHTEALARANGPGGTIPRQSAEAQRGVTIAREALTPPQQDVLSGLSEGDLARITGARAGDTIRVEPGAIGNAVRLTLDAPQNDRWFEGDLRRNLNSDGRLVLANPEVRNDALRSAASGREVVRGLLAYRRAGIDEIQATAMRGTEAGGWNGYYTWARLGFKGPIPRELVGVAQERFGSDVTRVEQLMARPGGPQWWKVHGDTWHGVLDFHDPTTTAVLDYFSRHE